MDEEGMIDLPLKVNGLEISITPMSPLAMAGNMEKVGNVLQFLQISQSLGQAGMMLIKPEAVGDYILDNLNIDASLRTTPEERQMIIEQAQQMAMQQQQAAMAAQGGGQPPQEGEMEAVGGEPS